jgi:hypothetical protein
VISAWLVARSATQHAKIARYGLRLIRHFCMRVAICAVNSRRADHGDTLTVFRDRS